MKRMLLTLMFVSPLMALNECTALVRTAKGYSLQVDGFSREVNSYDVDARLRSMNGEQLGRLAAIGGLKAHQMSNGDYRIEIGGGLKGGGVVGAWLGSVLGYGGVHGATAAVCFVVTSPAYLLGPVVGAGVYGGVSFVAHALMQPVAVTAGVVVGVTGAVVTGPI